MRDRVPSGLYQRLVDDGRLHIAHGERMQPVQLLVDMILSEWGWPAGMVADQLRANELRDTGVPFTLRWQRKSDANEDLRATRKLLLDGNLSVEETSRNLIAVSLWSTRVITKSGLLEMRKKDTNNTGRDDVAASLVLCCGLHSRSPAPMGLRSLGIIG